MLLAPQVPPAFRLHVPLTDVALDLPPCLYLLALVAIGAAIQGSVVGGNRFLIGRAPPHRRISYVGFLNSVTSPLTLLPFAGAWLAQTLGLTALFFVVAAGGLLHLVWALRLSPARPEDSSGGSAGVSCSRSSEARSGTAPSSPHASRGTSGRPVSPEGP